MDPNHEPRYKVIGDQSTETAGLTIKIAECDRRDGSLFTCVASNRYGSDEYNHQLIVLEPPDRPEALTARLVDSRTASVSWLSSYSGNSPITGYNLQYKTSETSWQSNQQSVQNIAGTDTSATISGLKPVSTYEIRIRAQNKLGFSQYSDVLRVTTTEEVPSGPPLDIRVHPLSAHSLRVTFTAPKAESRNGRILGYYLGYKALDGTDDHFVFKKVSQMEYSSDLTYVEFLCYNAI